MTTPGTRAAVREVAASTVSLPMGAKYGGPSYRPLLTLTADGVTRGIVSLEDLSTFHTTQSEYVELTVLGNVAATYPSLRAVYLGQVSGSVIAVPAAYGIARGVNGCAVALDAIVDPSPQSASGCRFQVSATLAPVVDPGDLARLATDLEMEPTLDGKDLHLSLPTLLTRDVPSTLQSSALSGTAFGVGLVPTTFRVTADVVDDDLPSVVKVNMLLAQLEASVVSSLTGRLALQLDDAHEPVHADMVLNLRTTAASDDIAIVLEEQGAAVSNRGPHEVVLTRQTTHAEAGYVSEVLNLHVAAGTSVALTVPPGTDEVLLDRTLALPEDVPAADMDLYVRMTVTNVQSVHHVLGVNAIGQLAGLGLTKLVVTIALRGVNSGTALPEITLTPSHELEQVTVQVPIASVLKGLTADVVLTGETGQEAAWSRQLLHDFLTTPLLVLTDAELAPQEPRP